MNYTGNYNLKKPEGTDAVNIDDFNNNADILDTEINFLNGQIDNLAAYAVVSGTNTYTATISGITALTEGFSVKIKFTNANTGASTLNINSLGAKSILKGNGSTLESGNIKAGQICNLVYGGTNFQLLGEGGEYGTATASDVLSGKTIGTDIGLVEGTMPNRGAVNQNLTTEGQEYTIPSGYHNGLGKVKAVITGLVASVIKAGTTVGGILGTFTSDATATAAQMLAGTTAYVNGNKVTGTIVNRGAINQSLGINGTYTIPEGYHNGTGKVTQSVTTKGAQTYTPGTTNQTIAAGQYLSGVQTIAGSANLIADNIKEGVNIFGIVGILKSISGNGVSNVAIGKVSPLQGSWSTEYLDFRPDAVLLISGLDIDYIAATTDTTYCGVIDLYSNNSYIVSDCLQIYSSSGKYGFRYSRDSRSLIRSTCTYVAIKL